MKDVRVFERSGSKARLGMGVEETTNGDATGM